MNLESRAEALGLEKERRKGSSGGREATTTLEASWFPDPQVVRLTQGGDIEVLAPSGHDRVTNHSLLT